MSEVTIYNGGAFKSELETAMRKLTETGEVITSLSNISGTSNNQTLDAMLNEQKLIQKHQMRYILGLIKANYDTLPDALASQQKLGGVPLDLLVKLKVDEFVLIPREEKRVSDMTIEKEYWSKYRRLSETICGFGYNMYFIKERFERFFPDGMHEFVLGFAEGYSFGFHAIAAASGVETITTNPKTQDIWRNWEFFLKHDCHEYRLDGSYLYMYHGGANCSSDPNVPYGNNVKLVNKGVYQKLKARRIDSNFSNKEFDFGF